jgi:hypothetical protein
MALPEAANLSAMNVMKVLMERRGVKRKAE